jgi:DNA-binding transcriptional MerR regulator
MTMLSANELRRIEREYAKGISSRVIVETFQRKGERFSEPTLRKYVQLGLLPKSRRVGARGRHRGSSGLYPVAVVRLINEIKRSLAKGATLDEIRLGRVALSGEVKALQKAWEQAAARFAEAIRHQPKKQRSALKRTLDKHLKSQREQVRALEKLAARIGQPHLQE